MPNCRYAKPPHWWAWKTRGVFSEGRHMPGIDGFGPELRTSSRDDGSSWSTTGYSNAGHESQTDSANQLPEPGGAATFPSIVPTDVLRAMQRHHDEIREAFIRGLCGALNLNFDIVHAFSKRDPALAPTQGKLESAPPFTRAQDRIDDNQRITILELNGQATYEVFALGFRETFSAELLATIAHQVKTTEKLITANMPNLQARAAAMSDEDLAYELCTTSTEIEKRTSSNRLRSLKSCTQGELAEYMNLCAEREVSQAELSSRFNHIINRSAGEFGGRAARDFIRDHWKALNSTIHPLDLFQRVRLANQLGQIEDFSAARLRQGILSLVEPSHGDVRDVRCRVALNLLYRLAKLSEQASFAQARSA